MKLTEIFGKTLYYYNGWNGNLEQIKIDSISASNGYFTFVGNGFWGSERKIYVPADKVDELIATGKASATDTIDHCTIEKEWKIK